MAQLRGPAARTAILRAAHELLSTDDPGVPGLEAIAHRAGVTRATVYHHFHGRAPLFDALLTDLVVEHGMDRLVARSSGLPPLRALDAAVADCASFWRAERHLLRRLFAADPTEPDIAADLRRREGWRYDQFSEIVGRLRAGGIPSEVVAAVVSLTAFATWDQLAARISDDGVVVRVLQLAAASALRLAPAVEG